MRLKQLLATVGLSILPLELKATDKHQDDVECGAGDAGVHARLVPGRLVLLTEDQTASNTTDTAEPDHGGAAKGTLPLAAEVVGLVGHDSGDVAVGAGGDEEDTKVADSVVRVPSHDGEADKGENHVNDDDGTTEAVPVAEPGRSEHHDTSKGVGRSDKALRRGDAESHVEVEEDGQRVGKTVGHGGAVEEDERVAPDLPVGAAAEELAHVEGLDLGVATVPGDAGDDPVTLALPEEGPVLAFRVGEVDEEPVAGDTDHAGDGTFNGEDPAPTSHVANCLDLHKLFQ